MVKIVQNLVAPSKYGIKCPNAMSAEGITVHNTANDASAMSEINYMKNNNNEVSYHFAVDDKMVVQGLPLDRNGWHASDGNGFGNMKTIGIEICYSKSGGERFMQAERNAAELIAQLLKERGWGIDRVKRHYDYAPDKKYCPHRTMDLGWNRFLNMIQNCMTGQQSEQQMCNSAQQNSAQQVNVIYAVKTRDYGILPEVRNLEDNAGLNGSPITALAMKVDKGLIKYRVHLLNGDWLPYVTGYDWNDFANGFAGDGEHEIDAVEAYYFTPDDIRPYKKIYYKVNDYPYQIDNEVDLSRGLEGFGGVMGVEMTKFQAYIK